MDDSIKVVVNDISIKEFIKEMQNINKETHAFSDIKPPANAKESISITPEESAIIIAGINSLVLLISSILTFLANRKGGTIRVICASGEIIEFPSNTPKEKINYFLEKCKKIRYLILQTSDLMLE